MLITPHFKITEFKVSADYPDLAAEIEITEADWIKLWYLCSTILEPLRNEFGPIQILSGKRSDELNNAVKGSVTSDHLFNFVSCAADFTLSGLHETEALQQCYHKITTTFQSAFGQAIYYPEQHFIHVSLPTPKHQGEVFTK